MKYPQKIKDDARFRFFTGQSVAQISEACGVEARTLYHWIADEGWKQNGGKECVATALAVRIAALLEREGKSPLELLELERLLAHHRKLTTPKPAAAKGAAPEQTGTAAPGKKRGRKPTKNDLTFVEPEVVEEKLAEGLFEYQRRLWEYRRERTRDILKSRQIGLTYYFAKEAFADALLTGRNKIFISASRSQAEIFRDYIKNFALDWFEVELQGAAQIALHTPHGVATLYFLSTNSATGQGRHGDIYVDEYFWLRGFAKVRKLVGASAAQKQWSRTFFSTPSTTTHEAYKFWSGDEYQERLRREQKPQVDFPDFAKLRQKPRRCADGQLRWIITLDDAERMGCKLFDREQLIQEYSPEEFDQLFGCKFINDRESVFKFDELQHCLADSTSFPAPRKVWIGYDPSRSRDGACIVVIAPPEGYKGTFYVLEKISLYNASWQSQAETIRELTHKYHVEHIAIDCTGPGSGVAEMVQQFFPAAEGIFYTAEVKNNLVLKAQSVIQQRRLQWDAMYSDIAAGFLQIKKVVAGDRILYATDRTEKSGHADAAWAIMHALAHEELVPSSAQVYIG